MTTTVSPTEAGGGAQDGAPHALLVLAHPRRDSLTGLAADRARLLLERRGCTVDELDLHAEDFDPRMTPADEPDWADPGKRYSPEVRAHMDRMAAADAIVVVFPVWWYDVPAILKGWIDRVWNQGFAYGPSALTGKRLLWLGLAGASRKSYEEQGLGAMLDLHLRVGISEFCGVEDVTIRLVYDTVPGDPEAAAALRGRVTEETDAALGAFLSGATVPAGG